MCSDYDFEKLLISFIALSLLAFPKSPFERELQRLLSESAKNKMLAVNKTNNLDTGTNKKNANSNGSNNNNNNGIYASKRAATPSNGNNNNLDNPCVDSNSLKHPVGLEAIKEMTRNKNLENQT